MLRGREPDATDKQKALGLERQKQLSGLADEFIIRRMNRLNAQHLPPKLTQVVCCRLTPTQEKMYWLSANQGRVDAAAANWDCPREVAAAMRPRPRYQHVVTRRDISAAKDGHVKDT